MKMAMQCHLFTIVFAYKLCEIVGRIPKLAKEFIMHILYEWLFITVSVLHFYKNPPQIYLISCDNVWW